MNEFLREAQVYCTDKQLVVEDFDDQDLNRPKHRRTVPSNLIDDFFLDQDATVVREGTPVVDRNKDLFKRQFFFPFLDRSMNLKNDSRQKLAQFCLCPTSSTLEISKKRIPVTPKSWLSCTKLMVKLSKISLFYSPSPTRLEIG
jgi:hypothetical protein